MPGVSLQEYRELVLRSGLLTSVALQEQFDSYHPESDVDPLVADSARAAAISFAKHLENSGLLTEWQNANLLRGRFRGLMFGKFRILRLLGAGGMGRVFLAENQMLRRQVALKVLPTKLVSHPTALDRFHQEARALARLNHNNIVRVYDVDVHENTHYIVMEYVQGIDLHRKVAKEGPLDERTAANLICQAAHGLAHAHEAGLIHRDVKPANMLINGQGTIKVLDLGLALLQSDEDSSITADPTQALGTADYISPEQALNSRDLDARSDIYSLGCSLYFLLTGRAPFGSGTNSERLLAHQLKDPLPINDVRATHALPAVSHSLLQVCARMMAKAPGDRFDTAAAVANSLETIAGADNDSATDAIEILPDDFEENHSTLDAQSLEQLKSISESASISSIRGSRHPRSLSRQLNTNNPKKNRVVYWRAGMGAAAIALLAAGVFAMQFSSSDSTLTTTDPTQTSTAASAANFSAGTFYVVGNNRTYHTKECQHLQGKDNTRQVTQRMLDAGYLRPCRTCRPGSK